MPPPERYSRRRLLRAVRCALSPELTEGPYYLPGEAVRRGITEGRPGTPLRLHLGVVSASSCRPIKGAAVDVRHADASGVYSGVADRSGTFPRGVQRTDGSGVAVFDTIYPGWFRGRAVHIHVKVGGNPETPDAADAVHPNGGSRSLLAVRRSGDGWLGSIVMRVHTG